MRFLRSAVLGLTTLAALSATPAFAQVALKLPRVSPNATVTQTLGVTDLTVTYSRPGVKGRTIWGGLEAYDKPWRAGANEATTFTTTTEITFGGQKLAAGTYSLFMIPGKEEWTVVLNSEKNLWGAYEYKPELDVLRVKVETEGTLHQEWLSYSFDHFAPSNAATSPDSARLVMLWDKMRIAVHITVNMTATVTANCRSAVAGAKADDFGIRVSAARWCLDNGQALAEGRGWMEQALAIQKNYSTLNLQARWLAKEGKKKDAVVAGEAAIAAGKASADKPDTSGLEKMVTEWKAAK